MRRIMRPQDGIIACVPNVQHWSVQARLAGGNFWYEDMGLLDRTHIRFFTRLTLVKMFGDCGFRIVKGVPRIFPMENQDRAIAAIRAFAANLGLDVEACARDAAVFQYVLHAVPW
jgi:citrate lyase synthetase